MITNQIKFFEQDQRFDIPFQFAIAEVWSDDLRDSTSEAFMAMAARYSSAFKTIFSEENLDAPQNDYQAALVSIEVC